MDIVFVKNYGKWKVGDVVRDAFRNHALELIKKGIAEEYIGLQIKPREQAEPKPEKYEKAKHKGKNEDKV